MKIIKSIAALIIALLTINFGLLYFVHNALVYYQYKESTGEILYDAKTSGLVQSEGKFFEKYLDAFNVTVQKAYVTKHYGAFLFWTSELKNSRRVYVTLDEDYSLAKEIQQDFVFKFKRDNNGPSEYYQNVLIYDIGEIATFNVYPKEYRFYKYRDIRDKYLVGSLKIKVQQ